MFASPHGVRGLVRLRSFTEDPAAIADYKPLTDESGRRVFVITLKNAMNDHFIASVDGVDNREAAEALSGVKLYIDRAALPQTRTNEYYQSDLVGLAARGADGTDYGTVMGVHDYGGGPFLEIGRTKKDSFMLPFTSVCVPVVEFEAGRILIAPPDGWLGDEKKDEPSF